MDDIFINPEPYDLFGEPALAIVAGVWLTAILLLRLRSRRAAAGVAFGGLVVVTVVTFRPIISYLGPEIGVLAAQTSLVLEEGNADPQRERDPVFALLQTFRKGGVTDALAVVDDPRGEGERWARYYLHPHPVVRTDAQELAALVSEAGEARYALSRGAPAMPADVRLSVEERHGEWMLLRVSRD